MMVLNLLHRFLLVEIKPFTLRPMLKTITLIGSKNPAVCGSRCSVLKAIIAKVGINRAVLGRLKKSFNVNISSPHEGTIKVNFNPTQKVDVGDAIRIKATLNGAGENFDEIFWVKVSDREGSQQLSKKEQLSQKPDLGLPQYILAYENQQDQKNTITWEKLEDHSVSMEHSTIMHPMVGDEKLERIYINMDSTVLKNFKSKTRNPNEEQLKSGGPKIYYLRVSPHAVSLYRHEKSKI